MPLKVVNKTKWETRDLRRILAVCIREVRKTDDNRHMRNMRVTVVENGGSFVTGYAYYHSGIVRLRVPAVMRPLLPRSVARVFLHEIGHCLGRRHRRGVTIENCFIPFLDKITDEAYPMRHKPVVEKPKVDIITTRYARVLANLKKATSRLKRAKTIHQKWSAKVKYYEKKMAAKEG